ncbi:MAG TPA: acyltransferase domain-containing protein, partial [Thermoanaerobaculia bacterium]|nr:acyltransferase domain-containing protein [Thermoanaerobaculia bacterium]
EAHGTGTRLGDPIEARALAAVLCAGREADRPDRPLLVGSVKTNIGHQEGAAGIAGLIKLVLAIHHRTIPPSLHFETPNPDIPFEELRLRVQTALGPWPGEENAVGGVSSFGWGGTNCHMVLEGLGGGRAAGSARARGIEIPRSDTPSLRDGPGAGRPVVFVFSGVGSQWPGMARDLLREPLFRARLERCDRVLQPLAGWSVLSEVAAGDGEHWHRVEYALPLLAILQMALADLWRSWGVEPAAVVGHSVGEIPAAYTAGVFSLEEAARVAFWYSRSLHRIDGRGALGVVELPPPEAADRLSTQKFSGLELAAWLSPSSSVVAGAPGEVEALVAAVTAEGRFAARLTLQAAAHSSQLDPHLPEMLEGLADLAPRLPRIPLASTLTGALLDRPMDAAYWAENLRRPVLFAQAVETLLAAGHSLFLEVDPHPILATPLAQCFAAAGVAATSLPSLRRGEPAAEVLADSLAALGAAGLPVRAERLFPEAETEGRAELVPLSTRTLEALRDLARLTAGQAREPAAGTLSDLAWTAAVRRGHHEHRLAAVVRSRAELAAGLEAFARGEEVAGFATGRSRRGDPAGRGGVVFAFSGQGPQWRGMGRQLLAGEPVFRDTFERCDEALRPWLGEPLLARLDRDENALESTEWAQPALFALQVALAALWRSWGVTPDAVVGHSVGEIAAAHVAGALTLEQAARVAAVRGRAMEAARGRGGMVAVELSEDEVRAALSEMGAEMGEEIGEGGESAGPDRPWIAAVNSPSAVVVAGAPAALEAAVSALQARGAVCRKLRVDYPFHGPLMEPTDREVEAGLAGLRPAPAALPLISTVTGSAIPGEELDGFYWRRNVREPVLFARAVANLAEHEVFLEIGPHPVLAAAITQGLEGSGRTAAVLASLRRGRDERSTLLEALGTLYALGRPVDWHGVHPDGGRLVALPTYPFQRQRYWFEIPAGQRQEAAAGLHPDLPAPLAPTSMAVPAVSAAPVGPGEPSTQGVEQLFASQLDAFHRMVDLQLAVLRQAGDSLQDDF